MPVFKTDRFDVRKALSTISYLRNQNLSCREVRMNVKSFQDFAKAMGMNEDLKTPTYFYGLYIVEDESKPDNTMEFVTQLNTMNKIVYQWGDSV